MKLTNKNNFPEALSRAMQNDSYDKGACDFSVTELLKPPRVRALEKRHDHEIVEDVSDGLWRLMGHAMHAVLERANKTDTVEKRLFAKFGKHTISGQLDTLTLEDNVLSDWKFTTAWKFKTGNGAPPEYTAQLNMLLEILRRNGKDASALKIHGLLRDFQLREAKQNPSYPQAPVQTFDIEIWSREQTTAFIEERIALHVTAAKELPECSNEERWAKPDAYAVIKKGGKRAINGGVQFSMEAAEAVQKYNPGTFIEFRKGESTRCSMYCRAAPFCAQYKAEQNKLNDTEEKKNAI